MPSLLYHNKTNILTKCYLLYVDLLYSYFYHISRKEVLSINICEKFGLNVQKYRKKLGISQEELAELSGLHRTYISSIERGKRSISLNNIEKIAHALKIDIHLLFIFN